MFSLMNWLNRGATLTACTLLCFARARRARQRRGDVGDVASAEMPLVLQSYRSSVAADHCRRKPPCISTTLK